MQQGCNGAALEHGKVAQQWRARGKGSAIGGVRGRSRRGTREVGAALGIEREMGIGMRASGACILSWRREVSERRERWEMGIGLRY